MNEIQQAIKDIILKFLLWIKEGISWKLFITLLTIYISWELASREGGVATLVAAIISVLSGGTYVVTKTMQNKTIIQNGGIKNKIPLQAPEKPIDVSRLNVQEFAPPTEQEPQIVPSAEPVDWAEFWRQVEAEQNRLIKELPHEKVPAFARYEAIMNVGKRFPVSLTEDVQMYADIVLDAAEGWFRDIAGFDYWEAKQKGIPLDIARECGCSSLDAWISTKAALIKPIVAAIKRALDRTNTLERLQEGWQSRFPNWARTLNYVFENVM